MNDLNESLKLEITNDNSYSLSNESVQPSIAAEIDLNTVDLLFEGEQPGDQFGWDICGNGDFNGDGLSDLVIVAKSASKEGRTGNGAAYLIYGSDLFSGSFDLANADICFYGGNDLSQIQSVTFLGDVNADGYDDLLIGSENYSNETHDNIGQVYLIYGENSSPKTIDLHNADLILDGEEESSAYGNDLSPLGDINGDNYADFAIPAMNMKEGAGIVYIYLGGAGLTGHYLARTPAHLIINGSVTNGKLGAEAKGIGDIDGDGYDDFLLGAPYCQYNEYYEGLSYLFYGNPTFLSGNIVAANADAIFFGGSQYSYCGQSIGRLGDIDGDAYPDFAISDGSASAEKVCLYFGTSARFSGYLNNSAHNTVIRVTDGDAIPSLGHAVCSAGDLNQDGLDDFLISAPYNYLRNNNGQIFAIYGRSSWPEEFNIYDAEAMWIGEYNNDFLGTSLTHIGNFTNDDFPDILISSYIQETAYFFEDPFAPDIPIIPVNITFDSIEVEGYGNNSVLPPNFSDPLTIKVKQFIDGNISTNDFSDHIRIFLKNVSDPIDDLYRTPIFYDSDEQNYTYYTISNLNWMWPANTNRSLQLYLEQGDNETHEWNATYSPNTINLHTIPDFLDIDLEILEIENFANNSFIRPRESYLFSVRVKQIINGETSYGNLSEIMTLQIANMWGEYSRTLEFNYAEPGSQAVRYTIDSPHYIYDLDLDYSFQMLIVEGENATHQWGNSSSFPYILTTNRTQLELSVEILAIEDYANNSFIISDDEHTLFLEIQQKCTGDILLSDLSSFLELRISSEIYVDGLKKITTIKWERQTAQSVWYSLNFSADWYEETYPLQIALRSGGNTTHTWGFDISFPYNLHTYRELIDIDLEIIRFLTYENESFLVPNIDHTFYVEVRQSINGNVTMADLSAIICLTISSEIFDIMTGRLVKKTGAKFQETPEGHVIYEINTTYALWPEMTRYVFYLETFQTNNASHTWNKSYSEHYVFYTGTPINDSGDVSYAQWLAGVVGAALAGVAGYSFVKSRKN